MKQHLTRLALTLAAVATFGTRPAFADIVDGNPAVGIEILNTETSVYARVTVSARNHLALEGDMALRNNGAVVKVDPVNTADRQFFLAYIGPIGRTYSVCGTFTGTTWIGGDNYRPGTATACTIQFGSPGLRLPGTTTLPAPIRRRPEEGLRPAR